MGPSHDLGTWYGINYAGTQITQWDFQNKGKSGWTGKSSFVLEVPLRYSRPRGNIFRTMWPDCAKDLLLTFLDAFCLFSDLLSPLVTGPVCPRRIFRTCRGLYFRGFQPARTELGTTVLWRRRDERGLVRFHTRSLLYRRRERETDCLPNSPKW